MDSFDDGITVSPVRILPQVAEFIGWWRLCLGLRSEWSCLAGDEHRDLRNLSCNRKMDGKKK
jgi:hypothetical protein